MSHMRAWCLRFAGLFNKERKDRELAEELESHLQMHIEDNIRSGMDPIEARRQAALKFGGVESAKESYRERRGIPWLESLVQDVRFGLRMLCKSPGFTIVAVLTLALGIGATTAIFTLVHAVLLNSLPVAKPEELYRVGDKENCCSQGGLQRDWTLFSSDQYKTFRENTPGFVELAAFQAGSSLVGVRPAEGSQPAESKWTELVSGNYFATFSVAPFAGRLLTLQDDRKGAEPVAVMSYRAWQQNYGGDYSIVGASFFINRQPFTIVGIAAPEFFGDRLGDYHYQSEPPALWIPISNASLLGDNGKMFDLPQLNWLDLIGRIAPGADPKQIEARMQVELRQWLLSPAAGLEPDESALVPRQTLHLSPGGAGVQRLRDQYESSLRLLMWTSLAVLAIACTNVAGLMLVRATTRKQENSIRAALGASTLRQIRLALTESLLLALVGGLAGVALAYAGTSLILRLAFQGAYVAIKASPSWPVLAFTLGVSLLTGILFGVAPAWITACAAPADALRGAGRSVGGRSGWTQRSLVIVQAALSLVLLSAAGLLAQSLRNLHSLNFGFETRDRYIFHLDPQMAKYEPEQLPAFYSRLHDSLTEIPSVTSVSFSNYSPLDGGNMGESLYFEGQSPPPPGSGQNLASWARVSSDYFETVGTRIVAGRSFAERDSSTSRPVAVVNETFARNFFKGSTAIGQHFGFAQKYAKAYEIVGVTEDTVYTYPTDKVQPMFFLPATQSMTYDDDLRFTIFENTTHYLNAVEIRTLGAVSGLESQVRNKLAEVNPNLAIIDFVPFDTQVESSFNQQSMITKLASLFGGLALLLACVGTYGVIAYSTERRTNEIGVRVALGASRFSILRLVLRGALSQTAIALAIGIPAAIGAGLMMTTQLFKVKPYDLRVLLLTTVGLVIATMLAAFIPAWQATKVAPTVALRNE